MPSHSTVASPSMATSLLFDVVVFAGGGAKELSPLCNNEPRPMLSICNRPMIWYCLYPWIAAGCRTFFVCVNEDYVALQSYLCQEFPAVVFFFVFLPLTQKGETSTTCDAVKAYLDYKDSLLPEKSGQPRDALLLSCDTLLPGVDLVPFIRNFYCSMASTSVLLFRPVPSASSSPSSATRSSNGANAAKGQRGDSFAKPYAHRLNYVAYEEKDGEYDSDAVAGKSRKGKDTAADVVGVDSYRLHFMSPYDQYAAPPVSVAFSARRPNLTVTADTMDAHAYLVRHWVLRAIAEHAGQEKTVQRDIIPMLACSQHTGVNEKMEEILRPDDKIKFSIPKHWLFEKDSCVDFFNVSPGPVLPVEADNLLVCCTIYEEHADKPMRVYRVKTRDDFVAVNHEILSAKSRALNMNEIMGGLGSRSNSNRMGTQRSQQQSREVSSRETAMEPGIFSLSAMALGSLLPDSPWTYEMKSQTKQVRIRSSFLRSVPTGSAFITRSIIGSNVTLGENVRITNSIILNHVEIGSGAIITNSVIGSSAVVNSGVRVTNCTVGPQCLLESDGTDMVIDS